MRRIIDGTVAFQGNGSPNSGNTIVGPATLGTTAGNSSTLGISTNDPTDDEVGYWNTASLPTGYSTFSGSTTAGSTAINGLIGGSSGITGAAGSSVRMGPLAAARIAASRPRGVGNNDLGDGRSVDTATGRRVRYDVTESLAIKRRRDERQVPIQRTQGDTIA